MNPMAAHAPLLWDGTVARHARERRAVRPDVARAERGNSIAFEKVALRRTASYRLHNNITDAKHAQRLNWQNPTMTPRPGDGPRS